MATRTSTFSLAGRTTRNSRNAGSNPGIAFGTHLPRPAREQNNSDKTATENHFGGNHPEGDGDEPDDGDPGDPDDDPPEDDDGPGDHPNDHDGNDNDVQHNLADAIAALARSMQNQGEGSRSKVREPDPFDGTDPSKLRTFLVQLQLSFNDRPRVFEVDQRKVNFAISYLKGIALAHFENSLIEPNVFNPPAWEDDYGAFVSELTTYFGAPDIVGEAENKLENLSMKSTQHIAKYLVEFNRLATITGWDSRALRHQFYRGLPARIKDEVSQVGKPATLPALRTLAQQIDGRYWERDEETRHERVGQSLEKKTEKPHNQSSSSSNQNNQSNQNKTHKKPFAPRDSGSSSQNSDKKTSDLNDKIGKDGKLTLAERSRRFANNLCLFCGGVGHTAKECPKSSSSATKAKGRATKSKPDTKSDSTQAEDAKK